MWVYIVFPFLGATLAALLYYLHASVEDKDRKTRGLESSDYTKGINAHKEAYSQRLQQQLEHSRQQSLNQEAS